MINLVPQNAQNQLRAGQANRALVAFGVFVMVIFAIGFVMLLPSFIALRFMIADFSYAREVEEQSPSSRALEERTKALANFESRARGVLALGRKTTSFEAIVPEVVRAAPVGVDLLTMRFEEGTLAIEGYYQRRSLFLAFLAALETNALVKSVSSPLSNLLKETDASFRLTLSL